MPLEYEIDVTSLVDYALGLVEKYGQPRAVRILECSHQHHPGLACICGWADDGEMPMPDCR
jgi:hypothetical protein